MGRRIGHHRAPTVGTAAGVLALVTAGVLLTPVYWTFVSAVVPSGLVFSQQPVLIPPLDQIDLGTFGRIFSERPLLVWLANSLTVTLVVVLVTLLVSLPAGYRMSRGGSGYRSLLGSGLLLTMAVPGTMVIIPVFLAYAVLGLLNQPVLVGVAVASTTAPFATWMAKTYMDSIPKELDEAAAIDGSDRFRTFVFVISPLSLPAMGAIIAYSSIFGWANFLFARTLLTQGEHFTISVGIVDFIADYTSDWQGLMATGIVAAAPLVVMFLLMQRLLVEGLTAGSGK